MPWSTPTLRETRALVRDGIRAILPTADASVPNSILRVLSDAMGALAHLTLQYIDWLSKQLLPDTAESEWLDRHGNIWLRTADGSRGRKVATLATGSVMATGSAGTIVPLGALLVSSGQWDYETTALAIIGPTATPIPVRALEPGAGGNLDVGTAMSFNPPPLGADTLTTVVTMVGGADEETDDELRARILLRIQQPPMGGDSASYVEWALEVPGVTRAWCFPLEQGMGSVTLRFMMDDLRKDNNGIPLQEDVQAVQAYLDTQRPVAVKDIFVVAPIPFPISLNIDQLVVDDGTTRAAIEQSLKDMFLEKAIPGGTMYRSWVDAAISDALGEDHHELRYETTVAPSPGHLPIVGSIIYAG